MTDANRIHTTMELKEWALLLTLALLWGPTFYFTSIALTGLMPMTVVALRLGMAALVMLAVVVLLGERLEAFHFAGMGLIVLGLAAIDWRPFGAVSRLLSSATR